MFLKICSSWFQRGRVERERETHQCRERITGGLALARPLLGVERATRGPWALTPSPPSPKTPQPGHGAPVGQFSPRTGRFGVEAGGEPEEVRPRLERRQASLLLPSVPLTSSPSGPCARPLCTRGTLTWRRWKPRAPPTPGSRGAGAGLHAHAEQGWPLPRGLRLWPRHRHHHPPRGPLRCREVSLREAAARIAAEAAPRAPGAPQSHSPDGPAGGREPGPGLPAALPGPQVSDQPRRVPPGRHLLGEGGPARVAPPSPSRLLPGIRNVFIARPAGWLAGLRGRAPTSVCTKRSRLDSQSGNRPGWRAGSPSAGQGV